MPKPNYKYEKRQKEIAKKKKKEQKLQEKLVKKSEQTKADDDMEQPANEPQEEQ